MIIFPPSFIKSHTSLARRSSNVSPPIQLSAMQCSNIDTGLSTASRTDRLCFARNFELLNHHRLQPEGTATVLAAANSFAALSAAVLWVVTPLDGLWHHGAAPFGDLSPVPWFVVFLAVFPLSAIGIAVVLRMLQTHTSSHYAKSPSAFRDFTAWLWHSLSDD